MATKGESKSQKRISAETTYNILRKKHKFVTRPMAGPHPKEDSITLAVLLRDGLELAHNLREVKYMLNNRDVLVDGKPVTDYRRTIGLFDVIDLPKMKKRYVVKFDKKGRLVTEEAEFTENKCEKLCRVRYKRMAPGKRLQYSLNDGKQIFSEENLKTGTSVKVSVPENKIIEAYPLETENYAYITGGIHVGKTAKILKILETERKRYVLVDLEEVGSDKKFQTNIKYVFSLGKEMKQ